MEGDENFEDKLDVYSEETRNELVEDDELTPEESGFLEGYNNDTKRVVCAECKRIIIDPDDAIEAEINNETYLFCSEECYEKFKKRKQETEEEV